MFRHRKLLILFFCSLVLINVILITRRKGNEQLTFNTPVTVGTFVNNVLTESKKETIFVFIKPKCSMCLLYKDSIASLYEKYNTDLQFVGLFNPKYWDSTYLKSFKFEFKEVNNEFRKSLHLAVTPQFVLVENRIVSFSFNFKNNFDDEYQRLKYYLETKYNK